MQASYIQHTEIVVYMWNSYSMKLYQLKKSTKMIVLVLKNTNDLPYITEIINGVDNIQK
jgi:hypothetical protein